MQIFHDGISYLNADQEQTLREDLESGFFERGTERDISNDEEDKISEICNRISDWNNNVSSDDPKLIGGDSLRVAEGVSKFTPTLKFVLIQEIRTRFPNLFVRQDGEVSNRYIPRVIMV